MEQPRHAAFCVYILTNASGRVLYIGATNNLKKRLYHHQHGLVPGFTRRYNVHRLVYYEVHPTMQAARVRETALKGKTRGKKDALVTLTNPDWSDLSHQIG